MMGHFAVLGPTTQLWATLRPLAPPHNYGPLWGLFPVFGALPLFGALPVFSEFTLHKVKVS